MANIKVNDIKPAGADLFADNETFLKELSSNETGMIAGGGGKHSCCSCNCCGCNTKLVLEEALQ